MIGPKAGDILYLHEDGSVHKVKILQNMSDAEYVRYEVEVLEVIKPTFYGQTHPIGHTFDVTALHECGCGYWELKHTPVLES